jgi:hypothetical protein
MNRKASITATQTQGGKPISTTTRTPKQTRECSTSAILTTATVSNQSTMTKFLKGSTRTLRADPEFNNCKGANKKYLNSIKGSEAPFSMRQKLTANIL